MKGDAHTVRLDGSRGEGGGQILRTALTLSLLTARPFRMVKVRAIAARSLRGCAPQHKTAVEAAAELGNARIVVGAAVGSRELRVVLARGLRAARPDVRHRHGRGDVDRAVGAPDAAPAAGPAHQERGAGPQPGGRDVQPQGAGVHVPSRRQPGRGLPLGLRHADGPGDALRRLLPQGRRPARGLDRARQPPALGPGSSAARFPSHHGGSPGSPTSATTSPAGCAIGPSSA